MGSSRARAARSFSRLGLRDQVLTFRAAWLFALAELGLRTIRLARTARLLGVPLCEGGEQGPADAGVAVGFTEDELRRIRAVRRLSPHLYGSSRGCLRRALVLARMLSPRPVTVRFGVRRVDGALAAHAWPEVDGVAIDAVGPFHPLGRQAHTLR